MKNPNNTKAVRSEDVPEYQAHPLTVDTPPKMDTMADAIIDQALRILESRLRKPGQTIACSDDVKNLLKLKLAEQEREVFAVLFLDNRHRVIEYEELFYGTIDAASVHPREVVKAALRHNAAAVVLAHNHPSGDPDPSGADQRHTTHLRKALALIEVRVLDHIIVGGVDTVSFAERGLL